MMVLMSQGTQPLKRCFSLRQYLKMLLIALQEKIKKIHNNLVGDQETPQLGSLNQSPNFGTKWSPVVYPLRSVITFGRSVTLMLWF